MVRALRRRIRPLLIIGVPVAIAAATFVLLFFQPQKLFLDERVNEAEVARSSEDSVPGSIPTATPQSGPSEAAAGPLPDPQVGTVVRAAFRGLEHETTGQAVVTTLPEGNRVLRLEDFETSNGPDLRVYLSAGSSDARFGAEYGRDYIELGRLKGNIGNQNYEIPAGADLSRYRNVVIWCKRFSVGFGVATLG